ncbi:MAG: Mo-dependent nitrogenase C-terminal domain-containing protein [Coleofasciculaceae cyanobacterium]
MTSVTPSPYTEAQVTAWLRGLLTIAWADGHFDQQEQEMLADITHQQLISTKDFPTRDQPISASELAATLGKDSLTAENFMRTATMVALADGIYSTTEADVLHEFGEALGLKLEALDSLRTTLYDREAGLDANSLESIQQPGMSPHPHSDVLQPVRTWLDGMEMHDPRVARFVCKMIPPQCPFERDVKLFGHKVVHIPPLCQINPLYEQLVGLRFRALSYLADVRGEDISEYC